MDETQEAGTSLRRLFLVDGHFSVVEIFRQRYSELNGRSCFLALSATECSPDNSAR